MGVLAPRPRRRILGSGIDVPDVYDERSRCLRSVSMLRFCTSDGRMSDTFLASSARMSRTRLPSCWGLTCCDVPVVGCITVTGLCTTKHSCKVGDKTTTYAWRELQWCVTMRERFKAVWEVHSKVFENYATRAEASASIQPMLYNQQTDAKVCDCVCTRVCTQQVCTKRSGSQIHLLQQLAHKLVSSNGWILCCKIVKPLAHRQVCLPKLQQDVLASLARQDPDYRNRCILLKALLVPTHILLAPILAIERTTTRQVLCTSCCAPRLATSRSVGTKGALVVRRGYSMPSHGT